MKVLTKDVFYAKDKVMIGGQLVEVENGLFKKTPKVEVQVMRLFHNCKKYRDRDIARVEIIRKEDSDDSALYKCPHCDFEYRLDKHLRVA